MESGFCINNTDLKNTVYDELTLERFLKTRGGELKYLNHPHLDMIKSRRTLEIFWEQRVRYAYENMAMPLVNAVSLMSLPGFIILACLVGIWPMLYVFLIVNMVVLASSKRGAKHAKRSSEKSCWVWSPIVFWSYAITSWVANIHYLTGGLPRNGILIKKAG
jgi:hypothetical protein